MTTPAQPVPVAAPAVPAATPPAPEPVAAPTVTGTQAPEGFVSREEYERVEAQRRSFQADADRLRAAQPTVPTPAAPAVAPATGTESSDLDAFRRSLLTDVSNVVTMARESEQLRTRFPHADPSLFKRINEFSSPEAFAYAVEMDHQRVVGIVGAAEAAKEAALLEQWKLANPGVAAPPAAGATAPAGDPTVQQIAAMSFTEQTELERANPGVIERVLRSVS